MEGGRVLSICRKWIDLSEDEKNEAISKCRRMIKGKTQDRIVWQQLAKRVGVTNSDGIRRRLDPTWAREKNAQWLTRSSTSEAYRHVLPRGQVKAAKPADIAARLAEIPTDTRTFTARFFGDPLPGRSALDLHALGLPSPWRRW